MEHKLTNISNYQDILNKMFNCINELADKCSKIKCENCPFSESLSSGEYQCSIGDPMKIRYKAHMVLNNNDDNSNSFNEDNMFSTNVDTYHDDFDDILSSLEDEINQSYMEYDNLLTALEKAGVNVEEIISYHNNEEFNEYVNDLESTSAK